MAKKVLVVDDSPSVRQQVSLALQQAGYQVVEATDGQEGANAVTKTADLAMVISDVNMPNVNGIEMLSKIGTQIKGGLPVIMLTTEGQPTLIKQAKAAGAKGWIVKPFKAAQLVATVDKLAR